MEALTLPRAYRTEVTAFSRSRCPKLPGQRSILSRNKIQPSSRAKSRARFFLLPTGLRDIGEVGKAPSCRHPALARPFAPDDFRRHLPGHILPPHQHALASEGRSTTRRVQHTRSTHRGRGEDAPRAPRGKPVHLSVIDVRAPQWGKLVKVVFGETLVSARQITLLFRYPFHRVDSPAFFG